MFNYRLALIGLMAVTLVGCDDKAPTASAVRPVKAVTVERPATGEAVSMTGAIRAQIETSLAFRVDGRLIERRVDIGQAVKPGQVIARLDPQIQQNSLRQAEANLSATEGQLVQARSTFKRQQDLLKDEFTPRSSFDQAQQALQTAQANVDAAKAQLRNAREQLGYTELTAEAAGTVTAKGAEPGEVVAAGRMIVQVARDGGRDAVFDVPAQLLRTAPPDPTVVPVEVALTDDPTVKAIGHVREIGPQADPATRTFQVKVGLIDPPPAMRLGATITGRIRLPAPAGVELPAGALTEADGHPAVWVVDPQSKTVSLRQVAILRHEPSSILISQGLETGQVVVTAGVQTLRPGQTVRLLGDSR